jgi:hypothetical protein
MKTKIRRSSGNQASVLMISLLLCMIMGISLASYLTLTRNQLLSVRRSQSWNASLSISEAGIEEGLCHINSPSALNGVFASNGWTQQPDGSYTVTRNVDGGYYTVTITIPSLALGPVITCQGFSQLVLADAGRPMFAAAGVEPPAPQYSSRKVQVTTKLDALLTVTMAAKDLINLSGNNVGTDSFDSSDPNYSTNGLYDPTKNKANGDVVTDSTITNAFNLGNADIRGTIRTGPKGQPYLGPNASVGDLAWVNGGTSGIQAGHFFDDMNVTWPDVMLPGNTWITAPTVNTNIGGVNYKYYLTSGNWRIDDLSASVYVDGNAVLYIPPAGRMNMSGNDQIYIAQNSVVQTKSLKIFAAPATTSLGGKGVINATGNALNFEYFGLPSNTAFGLSANAAFVGIIYCPNAAFTLGGGGNNSYDFVGASVSKTIKMNGSFNFHYDENLRRIGPGRGYVATSWTEL